MLLTAGKINDGLVEMLKSWRHSGFNVHCGRRVWPDDASAMENIARYIIRASFSQERMTYIQEQANVVYQSKDGKTTKTFDALEWIAEPCLPVRDARRQVLSRTESRRVPPMAGVRYYGYYSNVSRGRPKKAARDDVIPHIIEGGKLSSAQRKSWARLIFQ